MGISQSELIDLNAITIAEFLSSVFETHEPLKSVTGSKKSVLHEIGISRLPSCSSELYKESICCFWSFHIICQ